MAAAYCRRDQENEEVPRENWTGVSTSIGRTIKKRRKVGVIGERSFRDFH